ncbi:peptidase C15 pyroglutamyl peptidase I-like protein [Apiospora arundinis]|uniref:Peptidase C15 pyroglutamyl peptidase I-like protein n=1 Tax=Apiospora arundinis TaxID=335852 RepID=A0ABR2I3I1_9PEZI
MTTTADKTPFRILVAGFGRVSHVQPRDLPNPAFEIIKRLPPQLAPPCTTNNSYNRSHPIEIIAHPDPLPSSYHGLLQTVPALVREHADTVDLILLIGVAVGQQYYSVEQSAGRDGYHEVPDLDRRTLAKGEGVKIWGRKSRERLATSVDLEAVVEGWREGLAATSFHIDYLNGKNRKTSSVVKGERPPTATGQQQLLLPPEVRHTDDVGSYVCGLVYYTALAELRRIAEERAAEASKTKTTGEEDANGSVEGKTVFLHVPLLLGEEQLEVGYGVVVALIRALGVVVPFNGS